MVAANLAGKFPQDARAKSLNQPAVSRKEISTKKLKTFLQQPVNTKTKRKRKTKEVWDSSYLTISSFTIMSGGSGRSSPEREEDDFPLAIWNNKKETEYKGSNGKTTQCISTNQHGGEDEHYKGKTTQQKKRTKTG